MSAPRIPQRRVPDVPTPHAGMLILALLVGWGVAGLVVFGAVMLWRAGQWVFAP